VCFSIYIHTYIHIYVNQCHQIPPGFQIKKWINAWKIGGNTGSLNKSPEKFIHILDKNKSSVCVHGRATGGDTGGDIYNGERNLSHYLMCISG
jgi:hypothetical protein